MADGRFLSKKIAHDLELNASVSLEADYLFARCIPHLDREGRMVGHPAQVKGIAVPLRAEMTVEVVDRCLGELAGAGLVLWYEVDGRSWLAFKGFDKNQKGLRKDREAESEVPSPHHPKLQRVTSVLRESSGPTPDNSRLSEVKVSEVKVSSDANASGGEPPIAGIEKRGERRAAYLQHFMPILREVGLSDDDTNGSILKALADKRAPPRGLEEAIRGLVLLPGVAEMGEGELRFIYAEREGTERSLWAKAKQAYTDSLRGEVSPMVRGMVA